MYMPHEHAILHAVDFPMLAHSISVVSREGGGADIAERVTAILWDIRAELIAEAGTAMDDEDVLVFSIDRDTMERARRLYGEAGRAVLQLYFTPWNGPASVAVWHECGAPYFEW